MNGNAVRMGKKPSFTALFKKKKIQSFTLGGKKKKELCSGQEESGKPSLSASWGENGEKKMQEFMIRCKKKE